MTAIAFKVLYCVIHFLYFDSPCCFNCSAAATAFEASLSLLAVTIQTSPIRPLGLSENALFATVSAVPKSAGRASAIVIYCYT